MLPPDPTIVLTPEMMEDTEFIRREWGKLEDWYRAGHAPMCQPDECTCGRRFEVEASEPRDRIPPAGAED